MEDIFDRTTIWHASNANTNNLKPLMTYNDFLKRIEKLIGSDRPIIEYIVNAAWRSVPQFPTERDYDVAIKTAVRGILSRGDYLKELHKRNTLRRVRPPLPRMRMESASDNEL